MTREPLQSKQLTMHRACGRWYRRRSDAYYAIAKHLVMSKYPAWLQQTGLDEDGGMFAGDDAVERARWLSRRSKSERLFMTEDRGDYGEPSGLYFDPRKWQWFVRRVARFLAFVDSRKEALCPPA